MGELAWEFPKAEWQYVQYLLSMYNTEGAFEYEEKEYTVRLRLRAEITVHMYNTLKSLAS